MDEIVVLSLVNIEVDGEWVAPASLVNSIRQLGQRQPVQVVATTDGKYLLADGRKRYAALVALGQETVKAIIVPPEIGLAVMTLAGNLQRRNPLSEARAIEQIGDLARVRQVSGLNKGEAQARLRLLKLAPRFQFMLERGELTLTAAKELLKLPVETQGRAWERACALQGKGKRSGRRGTSSRRRGRHWAVSSRSWRFQCRARGGGTPCPPRWWWLAQCGNLPVP